MANKKATVKNFKKVALNMIEMFEKEDNKQCKKFWVDSLNTMLDDMMSGDFFGTEGQCDPRGDNRY
jgi:hypothetical protein